MTNGIRTMVLALAAVALASNASGEPTPKPRIDGRLKRVRIESGAWNIGWGVQTGDVVPHEKIRKLYYLDEPCHLPVADAGHMRYYYQLIDHREGCWWLTMDGGYSTIMKDGSIDHSPLTEEINASGLLSPDNSVQITEPNFDSDTWVFATIRRQQDAQAAQLFGTDKQR